MLNTFLNNVDWILSRVVVFIMSVLVLNVLLQIGARYILGDPFDFTEELARYLLIWLALLASTYAYSKRLHVALDLLITKLSRKNAARLNMFIHATIGLFALLVLTYGGALLVELSFELDQTSAAMGIPIGYVYLVIPVSGILMTLYAINFVIYFWNDDMLDEDHLKSEQKSGITPE